MKKRTPSNTGRIQDEGRIRFCENGTREVKISLNLRPEKPDDSRCLHLFHVDGTMHVDSVSDNFFRQVATNYVESGDIGSRKTELTMK